MDVIPQKELRNHVGEVLRRVEAGENLTVTVAGRPVAEHFPARPRRWVGGEALTRLWQGPTPRGLDDAPVDVVAAISVVSLSELHLGVLLATDADERARRVDRLAAVEATFDPLPVTPEVARSWGRLPHHRGPG